MPEGKPETLSTSEWKVMKIVWELGSCAARDVYTVTQEKYGWAPGTTKTFLRRLVEKGHLTTTQIGNSYLYKPASSALQSLKSAADSLMENALEGTTAPLVFHLVKKGKLSGKEVAELRSMLDSYEQDEDEGEE